MHAFLRAEADLRLQDFVGAGRAEGLGFDEIYRNLRKQPGKRGLSNSEVALAAAMWSAHRAGARLQRVSLVDYFPPTGPPKALDALFDRLVAADGILISTPVYFGDRSSVCQSLIEEIRKRPSLREKLRDKAYGGISVGAKRNGGQETTLIYQLMDMVDLGMLGVGNDSDTTAQYGGTCKAGDVGTAADDDYGLDTARGTGRRLTHVARLMKQGLEAPFGGRLRVMFWLLQDRDGRARAMLDSMLQRLGGEVDATLLDITDSSIHRCIACDICPTHVEDDARYRCIIRSKKDDMASLHHHFADQDAVVPVLYSSSDGTGVNSGYQEFIERTRYLRRGDYLLGDTVTAPLILQEVGSQENMHVRATTSLIRHHTVVSRPMIGYRHGGRLLNGDALDKEFSTFLQSTRRLCGGRLPLDAQGMAKTTTRYNPVGYVLSAEKDSEDEKLNLRAHAVKDRRARRQRDAKLRLGTAVGGPDGDARGEPGD